MKLLRLARGAKIVSASALTKGGDALCGTQHLLTAAGREQLKKAYQSDFASGATAVMTSLDTSHDNLDAVGFFSDYSRDNDLSYYVIGKGNGEGGYELQGKGYTFLVPRGAGVSVGERRNFASVLCNLAAHAAAQGRAEALAAAPSPPSPPLLGSTIQFSALEDGTHLPNGRLHLGFRMEAQITSAAAAAPDFFAVAGCTSAADVDLVSSILSKNKLRSESKLVVDLRGMDSYEAEPSTTGFDIPALLLVSTAGGDLGALAAAAAKSEHICGLALVDGAPRLGDAELDGLHAQLGGDGALLAGPCSSAEGELVVLRD